jgi:hypothetical protein
MLVLARRLRVLVRRRRRLRVLVRRRLVLSPSTLLVAFSSSEDAVPLPVDVAVPLLVDVDALDAVDGLPVVVLVRVDVDASWPGLTCS